MLPLAHTNDMVPEASPVILVMSYDDDEDSSSDSEDDRESRLRDYVTGKCGQSKFSRAQQELKSY